MDIQNFFTSQKRSHICILFIIFTNLAKRALSVNQKFQDCAPRGCGNGPNISYPFWILDEQESFCGYPSFGITCNEQNPVLKISNDEYIIKDIFYSNHSLLLANAAAYRDACPTPLHNVSLDRTPFNLSMYRSDFSIFYNCTSLPQYPTYGLDCASNGTTLHSLAVFYEKALEVNYPWEKRCQSLVDVPVDMLFGVNLTSLSQMNYTEILKMGFLLNWTAPNCSSCEKSGGRCGFDNGEFVCFCQDWAHHNTCDDGSRRSKVMIIVLVALSAGIGVLMVTICCFKRKLSSSKIICFWKKESQNHKSVEAFLRNNGPLAIRRYSYSNIKKMTNFFRDKLGEGGFGGVYKGKLQDGSLVAVKVLKESRGNGEEFINEVASISRTSHVNIVTLMGFCFEGPKRALIYEFMPNGSLEKFIYKKNPSRADCRLEWETTYKIALGIAHGLDYLHKGCNTRILHFDIKPHNILLDENFCPKISDFGLAKICAKEESIISMLGARGTAGYVAPELICRNIGRVSHKSDVYSYGMMVLEMVGGRKNVDIGVDHTSELYFPHWIYKRLELEEELGLEGLMKEDDKETARKLIIVSLWCIQTDPLNRPPMSRVVKYVERKPRFLTYPTQAVLVFPAKVTHISINYNGIIDHGSFLNVEREILVLDNNREFS
ncbi:LEAF RUST 10 DISEASE-RESISTANCE LOCUS RECEPTOR-LIKE PROTEIN KINASE-like 2.1 [Corylus avellana]|uniref:LEAF RUST 10 DISEASE-RESISTANCE LOCUS RECEPTOR-LIKE PROTEIN KINASE-like 2.1 n=1 Tax=Corylus avellana TaxID=13451 RepID=UPI00286BC0DE|nr:LEAF RUST 10 DISEASE-RESISTANCE LOCUS RECEPTOR-LIKE PROTEIN KINASE-like 2.1 [Corylus avellana]